MPFYIFNTDVLASCLTSKINKNKTGFLSGKGGGAITVGGGRVGELWSCEGPKLLNLENIL